MIKLFLREKSLFHAAPLLFLIIFSSSFSSSVIAKRDPEDAFKYQKHMAQAGYRSAIYKLAEMYKDGYGAPQNLNKALELYRESARKGYRPAERRIPEVIQMIELEEVNSTKSQADGTK